METSVSLDLMYNMDKVFVYKCSSYTDDGAKEKIYELLDNFPKFKNVKKGTKVIIKANLVSALPPSKEATTNPYLLSYLTNYLLEKDCEVIIGDSPGGIYSESYLSHVYKVTKMNETGAKLNNNFGIKDAYCDEAFILKKFEYTSYLDDADLKINFSKLKTHAMMALSCSVKNLFGTIPGVKKPEYHYRFPNHSDFANMLIDLNEYFKFDLNIIDGVVGMEGNGPTNGTPKEVGVILGSENPYLLDFIAAQVTNLDPDVCETIKQSKIRGLFNPDEYEINMDIDLLKVKDFKLIKGVDPIKFFSTQGGVVSALNSKIVGKILETKPMVVKKKCIGCGKCANICPMKAITIVSKKAVIDRNKCIKCFCCQEFCPVGAMVVKKNPILKIINK